MNAPQKIKRYVIYGILLFSIAAIIICCVYYKEKHSFSTEKWINTPDERALFVNDLLTNHNLIGMSEDEILNLLGDNDNRMGTFVQDNRYVYCLGLEGQLFKIDNQWLILDFTNNLVSEYSIMTD